MFKDGKGAHHTPVSRSLVRSTTALRVNNMQYCGCRMWAIPNTELDGLGTMSFSSDPSCSCILSCKISMAG